MTTEQTSNGDFEPEENAAAEAAVAGTDLDDVLFIGTALAPFFLEDPHTGDARASFEALAALDAEAAGEDWPFVDTEEARSALRHMQEGLAAGIDDEDLMWAYRRLFVGPGRLVAPPWGSVYTDHECVIFGESTLDLRAWMRDHGIERITDERTPEDHIGLMLAMLSFLVQERPELVDEYAADHLLTWAPHYLEQLEQAAEHPFYEGLARLTRLSLEGLQQERQLDVTVPRFYR